jgi:hypothetical protein
VGRSLGVTYRIYPEPVLVTIEWGSHEEPPHPMAPGQLGEHQLGEFHTFEAATRFVNLHFADLGRRARERALRRAHTREGVGNGRH